jgi:hypothetical protein
MSELGDRLRSAAVLCDRFPNWTGFGLVATTDDVTITMATDQTERRNFDLAFALLLRAAGRTPTEQWCDTNPDWSDDHAENMRRIEQGE